MARWILVAGMFGPPAVALAFVLLDASGWGTKSQGSVGPTETGGRLLILDRGLGPGESIGWHLVFDGFDRSRWLRAGQTIRVVEVPICEDYARVELVSGPGKGAVGWVRRELITPGWYRAASHRGQVVLRVWLASFATVGLLVGLARVVGWVAKDPDAIYSRTAQDLSLSGHGDGEQVRRL